MSRYFTWSWKSHGMSHIKHLARKISLLHYHFFCWSKPYYWFWLEFRGYHLVPVEFLAGSLVFRGIFSTLFLLARRDFFLCLITSSTLFSCLKHKPCSWTCSGCFEVMKTRHRRPKTAGRAVRQRHLGSRWHRSASAPALDFWLLDILLHEKK